jgi:serine/threonine protein kinase
MSASNVLVEIAANDICPKLLDFGLSRRITTNSKPMGGTLRYEAPEIICGPTCSSMAADVFSFGRILFVVTTGTLPLQGLTRQVIVDQSRCGSPRLNWPAHTMCSLHWELAEQCMQSHPPDRPNIADVFVSLVLKPEQEAKTVEPWHFDWETAYPRLQSAAEATVLAKIEKKRQQKDHKALPKVREEPQQYDPTNSNHSDLVSMILQMNETDVSASNGFDESASAEQDESNDPNGPVLVDVSVEFDALSPSQTLLGCTLKFCRQEGPSLHAGASLEWAKLGDVVPASVLQYILSVSQDTVNKSFFSDELLSAHVRAVPINVPSNLISGITRTLDAGSCRLDVLRRTHGNKAPVCLTWHALRGTQHCTAGSAKLKL